MNQETHLRIRCLLKGIWISAACSVQYYLPGLIPRDISRYPVINAMQYLAKWIGGYGPAWTALALSFAYWLYRTERKKETLSFRLDPLFKALSLLFGILNTLGLSLHYMDELPTAGGPPMIFLAFMTALGWSFFFETAAFWFLVFTDPESVGGIVFGTPGKTGTEKNGQERGGSGKRVFGENISDTRFWLSSAGLILLSWLPWIISYYPASMDNDVFFHLDSVLGYLDKSNYQPWFVSRIMVFFYQAGAGLGSEKLGIFLYVVLRDILAALIYGKGIVLLKRAGAGRWFLRLSLLYYAVTPVWCAYAKHAFKDTFAAALFCWYITAFCAAVLRMRKGTADGWCFLEIGLSGLLASLFRNNVIIAVLPPVLLLAGHLAVREKRLRSALLLTACLGCFFLYHHWIYTVEGVHHSPKTEAFSVPFQQTARVVSRHKDSMAAEEKELLSAYWDLDRLAEVYDPILSDPVRFSFHKDENHTLKDYLKIWARMLPEYPGDYIEAFIAQSYGYYAFTPKREYWEGNFNAGMAVFDWLDSLAYPALDVYDLHYVPELELMRQLLDKWADLWDRIPVLNLTDMIALYTWTIVLTGYALFRKRRFPELLPVFSCLLLILTCTASPVNDCFRYVAGAAASWPVLIALLSHGLPADGLLTDELLADEHLSCVADSNIRKTEESH